AYRGEPNAPAYGAAKAGLHAMTQSLAVHLAPHGIAVAAVAPGFVATEMAEELLSGPAGDGIRAQSPYGRVAEPDEIAAAAALPAGALGRRRGDRPERGVVPALRRKVLSSGQGD